MQLYGLVLAATAALLTSTAIAFPVDDPVPGSQEGTPHIPADGVVPGAQEGTPRGGIEDIEPRARLPKIDRKYCREVCFGGAGNRGDTWCPFDEVSLIYVLFDQIAGC